LNGSNVFAVLFEIEGPAYLLQGRTVEIVPPPTYQIGQ